MSETAAAPTKNAKLLAWVEEIAALTRPDAIHWCDGSAEEYDRLCQEPRGRGTFKRSRTPSARTATSRGLIRPTSPASRTAPTSAPTRPRRGPKNNWREPAEMREVMNGLFDGAMQGRTMYVVPFSMGPLGSDKS